MIKKIFYKKNHFYEKYTLNRKIEKIKTNPNVNSKNIIINKLDTIHKIVCMEKKYVSLENYQFYYFNKKNKLIGGIQIFSNPHCIIYDSFLYPNLSISIQEYLPSKNPGNFILETYYDMIENFGSIDDALYKKNEGMDVDRKFFINFGYENDITVETNAIQTIYQIANFCLACGILNRKNNCICSNRCQDCYSCYQESLEMIISHIKTLDGIISYSCQNTFN